MGLRRLVNVLGNHVSCEPGALHSAHISAWEGSSVSREAPDLRSFQRIILAGTQWQHPIRFRSHRGPTHIDHCGGSIQKSFLISFPFPQSTQTYSLAQRAFFTAITAIHTKAQSLCSFQLLSAFSIQTGNCFTRFAFPVSEVGVCCIGRLGFLYDEYVYQVYHGIISQRFTSQNLGPGSRRRRLRSDGLLQCSLELCVM